MDWTVRPGTPISQLARPLRYPALVLRNVLRALRLIPREEPPGPGPGYVYEADGLATVYFSPFLADREWARAYDEMARDWYPEQPGLDIRWRMWILTSVARQVRGVPGDFAEFGVYRAGCARMILETAGIPAGRRYHLFDTFAGIPESGLTEREREEGYAGRLDDTSVALVEERLERWRDEIVFHVGDVSETIPKAGIEDLALAHLDLNASAPTRLALEYVYRRLAPGGAIVFDDYGWNADGYEQRDVIDEFSRDVPESPIALPSGQALLVRLPGSA
ncbi:MAG TPA: TylF/MycF/NovP-related O-methyltransferase [Solirubrobacterales bacterium]|nr:TylF/MycF/NovP-related O-methyltransferase [Solirubrobacterales bacterium]